MNTFFFRIVVFTINICVVVALFAYATVFRRLFPCTSMWWAVLFLLMVLIIIVFFFNIRFRRRQQARINSRPPISKEQFIKNLVVDDIQRESAEEIFDMIVNFMEAVPEGALYPDDDLLNFWEINDEDLFAAFALYLNERKAFPLDDKDTAELFEQNQKKTSPRYLAVLFETSLKNKPDGV